MQDINITKRNIKGKCDLKCAYNFKYPDSNLVAKNDGVMVSLTYDNNGSSPVMYNNQKYNVTKIYLTTPSIHAFNGSLVDAEICVEHTPVKGGSTMSVGIPIISSSESSTASNLLSDIIDGVAMNAPGQGDSTNLNTSGFSLQKIVPNKPFYSYTNSVSNDEWIVFDTVDAISLSSSSLTKLGQIIKPFTLPMMGGGLFYNSTGPNSVSIGEGIYIKCNPTGDSMEETGVEYEKNTTSYNWAEMINNPASSQIVQIIVIAIFVYIALLSVSYLLNSLTGIKMSKIMPTMSSDTPLTASYK